MNTPLPIPALHALLDLVLGPARLPELDDAEQWMLLLDAAERAAVAPTVDANLLRLLGPLQNHPRWSGLAEFVHTRAADNAATASAWHADLVLAAVALQRIGVLPIALKGAALVAHGIVPLGERHVHDIDLLIPAPRARDALEALHEFGFVSPPDDPLPGVDGKPRELSRWRDPHIAFHVVGPYGTALEVHRIASRITGETWDQLSMFTVPADLGGASVLVPTVHRLRRMLNEHVFVSHLSDPRLLLRHVADLVAIERWAAARVVPSRPPEGRVDRAAERVLLRLARAREPEQSALTRAQRFFLVRDGDVADQVERVWHFLEAAEVGWHDARHRPLMLFRRIYPHPAYLAALYGTSLDEATSLGAQVRRWRELGRGLGGARRRE